MVDGFTLGGVAQGLQRGANMDIANRRVALAEEQDRRNAQGDLMNQVQQRVSSSVQNIAQTAQALREQGKSPQEIQAVLEPAIESVTSLANSAGLEGNLLGQRIAAQISVPQRANFNTVVQQNLPRVEEFIKAAEKSGADLASLADSPQFQALVEPITRAAAQQGMDPQEVANQINARIQSAAIRAGQADVQGNVISAGGTGESESIDTLTTTTEPVTFLGVPIGPIREPDSPTERKILNKAQTQAIEQEALVQDIRVFRDLIESTNSLGPITESTQPLVRAFAEIGINLREDQPLLEAIQSRQNLLALKFRNPDSGFGLTGNTSDRDVSFLQSIPTGIGNTKEGAMIGSLLLLIKLRRQAEMSAIRANLLARGEGSKVQAVTQRFKQEVDAIRPDEREFIQSLINRAQGGELDSRPATELSDEEMNRFLGR